MLNILEANYCVDILDLIYIPYSCSILDKYPVSHSNSYKGHFANQSEIKVTFSRVFSRHYRGLPVLASRSDGLIVSSLPGWPGLAFETHVKIPFWAENSEQCL